MLKKRENINEKAAQAAGLQITDTGEKTMCGIVGYIGKKQAAPILLDGLGKLEYRGYDSAGLAVRDGSGDFEIVKAKGRLKVLCEKTNGGLSMSGCCGIGHTRWATHGEPSENNAHPHISNDGTVVGTDISSIPIRTPRL